VLFHQLVFLHGGGYKVGYLETSHIILTTNFLDFNVSQILLYKLKKN
jgi:hypothetical protein